jgi:hypothetical protein
MQKIIPSHVPISKTKMFQLAFKPSRIRQALILFPMIQRSLAKKGALQLSPTLMAHKWFIASVNSYFWKQLRIGLGLN